MEDRFNEVEQQIADLGKLRLQSCETALQDFVSVEETQRLTQELADAKSRIAEDQMAEWEEMGRRSEA